MGLIFITHNLAVVAEIADRVCVMYAGEIVEEGAGRGGLCAPAPSLYGGAARQRARKAERAAQRHSRHGAAAAWRCRRAAASRRAAPRATEPAITR